MGIDTRIVGLLKAKDEKALSLLYDNYSEVLYGVCFQILKDSSAAEDALQESFIKIWKNSHTYDQKKSEIIYLDFKDYTQHCYWFISENKQNKTLRSPNRD